MNSYADKTESQLVSNEASPIQSNSEPDLQFIDNRPEAIAKKRLNEMGNNSPQTRRLVQFQKMANERGPDHQDFQKSENNTSLPDNLKSGIEKLSNYSMDDVKVHYNSEKPAQFLAHAYAQGTSIHLGRGQEKHLPHEAWHVVQQKQGRVKPTIQAKGIGINDDAELEKEADVMGSRAMRVENKEPKIKGDKLGVSNATKQLARSNSIGSSFNTNSSPIQRTEIFRGFTSIPGTRAENDGGFKVGFALDTMSSTLAGKIKYTTFLNEKFDALDAPSLWDQQMMIWLQKLLIEYEDLQALELEDIVDIEEDVVEEEDGYAVFKAEQRKGKMVVLKAISRADSKIASALGGAGAFAVNLRRIRAFLVEKGSQYDAGHFLCSTDKAGDANELAHSKSGGTIELFKGFFDSGESRQADLLIHEAVHSVLRTPDYAYMWQPVFRLLPLATRLKNPDSYVAVVRGENEEAVVTPTTENAQHDQVLGMMQHVCMRGAGVMAMCKAQLGHFTDDVPPQPLRTLKAFRSNYDKEQLTTLINYSLEIAPLIGSLIIQNKVTIVNKDVEPTNYAGASSSLSEGAISVDYIASTAVAPFVVILARAIKALGGSDTLCKSTAVSLNEMASKGHMDSTTLLSTGL